MTRNQEPETRRKILIVDDELDMRIYLSALLETSGYEPIATKNGKEGLQKADERSPDLIILDVMMPEAGGANMYRELKLNPRFKDIPVIMLTAVGENSFSHYLKMLNVQIDNAIPQPDAFMEKPLDQEKLLELAQKLLS